MDSNNQPIKKSSLPQFSRRTDGDYFPSYELFDDLINRPSNDSFSTNLSSAAQDSLRSTVLELATRAWQVSALYRQGGAKDAMREMGYRWKQITPSAEIRTTLKIKPNEILKFFECALPVIRHSTDDLGIPKSHPSYSLICDEEYIDPVLKVELPVSSIQIYEKDRVAVLEKLGQRKVYDLVIFDESTHSGRLNEQIFHLFTTASDDLKSPLWNLADSQYGGYDSFSRFNAITFRKSESDQYPWRKLETWRDLDYQIDIIDRGCRYE